VAREGIAGDAIALGERLEAAGYDPQVAIEHGVPAPHTTVVRYLEEVKQEALQIRDEFVPGAPAIRGHEYWDYSFVADEGPVQIILGTDYRRLANGGVQVRVLDAGGGTGDTEHAATVLEEAGYDVVEVGKAPALYDNTIVACAPSHDEEGFRILKRFLPDAHFTGEVPAEDHDVTVYIGPDYRQGGAAGN
jgi:hypothetical protein